MIVDLFAGPGGWSEAAKELGLVETGYEVDADAVATARAAGHQRYLCDVKDARIPRGVYGLIASPPCQTFSQAGKGSGRQNLDLVLHAVKLLDCGEPLPTFDDPRTGLVLEPLRWALETEPDWIVLEQVPSVLPVWEAYADVLRRRGYSVVTGYLHAEQFGVPQTRKRAVLLASRAHEVKMPEPTHRKYKFGQPQDEGDPDLLPWVSMADALGWPPRDLVGFPRRADEGRPSVEIDGVEYRERDLRPADRPAQVVTEKARSWTRISQGDEELELAEIGFVATNVRPNSTVRPVTEPAPTLAFGHEKPQWVPLRNDQSNSGEGDEAWPYNRPATTVAGRNLIADPGANANRFNGRTKSRNDGYIVTPEEAAVLQGFRPDYPWRGTRTKQFQQIGNAIPPPMALAILKEVVS